MKNKKTSTESSNRSKFNVAQNKNKRNYKDILFDSEMEMKYFIEVIEKGLDDGSITHFERQKTYILQPSFKRFDKKILPIEYKADYYVKYSDGTEKVIDIKGFADPTALLKRKMFWFVYPDIDYVWISWSKLDGGWVTYETVKNGRKQRKKIKMRSKENKDE